MAIIKLSSPFTQISGKVGGTVFCKTANGQVMKNNAYSLPQFSNRQTAQRMKGTILPTYWSQLSTSEKADWQSLTPQYPYVNKVGQIAYYSAYALFLLLNQNLFFAGLPLQLLAPGKLSGKTFGDMIITSISSGTLNFEYTATGGDRLQFFGTRGLQVGRAPKNSDFLLYASETTTGTVTNFDMFTKFVASNGAIQPGLQYWFYWKDISPTTGQIFAVSSQISAIAS